MEKTIWNKNLLCFGDKMTSGLDMSKTAATHFGIKLW